ncbi:alpha/beta fold hydrolase [Blastococcus sp. SYSU DS0552]
MATVPPTPPAIQVDEAFVAVDSGRVRLLRDGEGPSLLYLHGVGDLGGWLPALAQLARAHRVLRPDHPGFNGSDDLAVATPADVAGVHLRLLDELGVDAVDVVGCSFGGWVAVELALLAPERVGRLVLIDPAGMPAEEEAPQVLDLPPDLAAPLTFSGAEMQEAARRRALDMDPVAVERDRRNREAARRLAGDPYMHDPALPRRAAALRMPVRLIWGEDDRIIPVSHARAWTAAIPHTQLAVVPGAGHLPHVERPDAFLAHAGLGVPAV